jgi:glycosyltransferase involved in cell wall biosynthesis
MSRRKVDPRIHVTFVQRKPQPGNFSLESIFHAVREQLEPDIRSSVWLCPYESRGVVQRLLNLCAAPFAQGDVTHVTGDINYVALFMRRARTIVTIPDIVALHQVTGWRRYMARLAWLQMPVWRAARVTTISEFARAEIIRSVGCPPESVQVIYVPVGDQFRPSPKTFNSERPRILMIGTAWNKNLVRQTEALAGIPCEVAFIGILSDEHRAALERAGVPYTSAYGLTNEQIVAQYERADLVLFASTYEGFGMPIVEANAVGRPVVTANTASMPEVAGDAACLVDPFVTASIRAGVMRVLADREYREGLVDRGFRNAARFSVASIARQYEALYRSLARD